MMRLNVLAAALAMALVAVRGAAQGGEDWQKQLAEIKARLEANEAELRSVKAENADLKSRIDGGPAGASALEVEINRLADGCDPCRATTVRSAANCITMGGELRFRRYASTGDHRVFLIKQPPGDGGGPAPLEEEHEGHWTDARMRINFRYDFACDTTAFVELQSHWAFGQDRTGPIDEFDGNDSEGNVGLEQAWVEFRKMFGICPLSTVVGRQELVFGNQFQLGNADWYNGVVFDGARIDWTEKNWRLTALMLKLSSRDGDVNQAPSFANPHDDDELYGLYFAYAPNRCFGADLYWLYVNGHGGTTAQASLNSGVNPGTGFLYPSGQAYFHTFGARVGGTLNAFCGIDYNAEAAYQTGSLNDPDVDVDALTAEAELGVTFSKSAKFRAFARGLYAEGPSDGEVGYMPLYPNRHTYEGFRARYGLADLIPMSNVVSAQVGVHFDPFCNWTFGATGLWATADESLITGIDDDYGYEIDVWGEWRYAQNVVFSGGVAIVVPDDHGQLIWGVTDETQLIGYLQARLLF